MNNHNSMAIRPFSSIRRLFVTLLCMSFTIFAYGQRVRQVSLDATYSDFSLKPEKEGWFIVITDRRDFVYTTEDTDPALPYMMVNVLVGANETYAGCVLQYTDSLVTQNIYIAHNPQAIPASMSATEIGHEGMSDYRETEYPVENVVYRGTHISDGYRVLSFLVCPFKYDVTNKVLYFKRQLTLEVSTVTDSHRQTRQNVGWNMRGIVRDMVINGDEIDSLYPCVGNSRSANTDDSYRYLILTNENLRPAFEKLAEWKTMKGVRSKVITVENICSPNTGFTSQEMIKMALNDYYDGSHTGLEYVLLGGDTNIVPAQMCYIKNGNKTDTTPTDLYYACLDDISWDGNGNSVYGEVEDSCDISPEIFVTRIPVRNVSDASAFVNRVIEYERNPKEGFWHNNILMGGCMVDTCYTINGVYMSDTQYKSEKTYNDYIAPNWTGTRVRFYDTATDIPSDSVYAFNAVHLQEQLSSGYNFVDIETHGNDRVWNTDSISYRHTDAASLTNNGYTIIFTTACNTNSFDRYDPCLSESFMRNHQGGILAYVGCSREGWYLRNMVPQNPSNIINEDIYDILFSGLESNFGKAVSRGKDHNIGMCDEDGFFRWLLFGVNPLGDPEMPVFISEPLTFDNVEVSFANGEVRANSNVSGCTFCIMDKTDNDVYYVRENASTAAVRNLDGVYQICITKPGYIPYIAIAGSGVYIQNETFDYPVHVISSNKTYIGTNVTNQQPTGNVEIKNRGSMVVKKKNGVTIENGFSVELGSTFEIK